MRGSQAGLSNRDNFPKTSTVLFLFKKTQTMVNAAMGSLRRSKSEIAYKARFRFIGIEHLTDTEIENLRDALVRECGQQAEGKAATSDDTVEHLLERL